MAFGKRLLVVFAGPRFGHLRRIYLQSTYLLSYLPWVLEPGKTPRPSGRSAKRKARLARPRFQVKLLLKLLSRILLSYVGRWHSSQYKGQYEGITSGRIAVSSILPMISHTHTAELPAESEKKTRKNIGIRAIRFCPHGLAKRYAHEVHMDSKYDLGFCSSRLALSENEVLLSLYISKSHWFSYSCNLSSNALLWELHIFKNSFNLQLDLKTFCAYFALKMYSSAFFLP